MGCEQAPGSIQGSIHSSLPARFLWLRHFDSARSLRVESAERSHEVEACHRRLPVVAAAVRDIIGFGVRVVVLVVAFASCFRAGLGSAFRPNEHFFLRVCERSPHLGNENVSFALRPRRPGATKQCRHSRFPRRLKLCERALHASPGSVFADQRQGQRSDPKRSSRNDGCDYLSGRHQPKVMGYYQAPTSSS